MDNKAFIEALNDIAKEKGISKDSLIEWFKAALISAYKKNIGQSNNSESQILVDIDDKTGDIKMWATKKVVEVVEDPFKEISLEEAKKINALYSVDELIQVKINVKPEEFGRVAAQTAKQVMTQKIREAEHGNIIEEYNEKEHEIVTAIVQRVEPGKGVYVELGNTVGIMSENEMVNGEVYKSGDRLKVYVLGIRRNGKDPEVMVSRKHPNLIKRLFELEVDEIRSGVVQIKSIAREAGSRTKIAVYSTNPNEVNAIGSCVGPGGQRVERIVSEINDEKIDIIEWDPDPLVYVSKALSPARVIFAYINEAEKSTKVIVPDNQLSLAIGKDGQNVRLAAILTGWKIDIKSESQHEEDARRAEESEENEFESLGLIDEESDEIQ